MDKVECECGCLISKKHIQKHKKTKKHIELMKVDKENRKQHMCINNRTLKVECECGSVVYKRQMKRHTETPKHKKIIKQKQATS